MTHEERVWHHEMETLEGIHEHAERIVKLEELCADMLRCIVYNHDCTDCLVNGEHCDASVLVVRARELEIEVSDE